MQVEKYKQCNNPALIKMFSQIEPNTRILFYYKDLYNKYVLYSLIISSMCNGCFFLSDCMTIKVKVKKQ
jgi:hypothetical protein